MQDTGRSREDFKLGGKSFSIRHTPQSLTNPEAELFELYLERPGRAEMLHQYLLGTGETEHDAITTLKAIAESASQCA
jgi:hypothetical protein